MRVLHLVKATGVAGAERHLLSLLPGLRERGCDPRLLVLVDPRKPVDAFLEEIRSRGIPAQSLRIAGDLDAVTWVRLWRRIRHERPTVVHTHLMHADLYGITAARVARVPLVITTRHNDDAFRRRLPLRLLNRMLWSRVDAGIAVSQSLVRFSRTVEGAAVPIRAIHHGIASVPAASRAASRASLDLPPNAVIIGAVCRLTRQKGVPYLLEAFAAITTSFPHTVLLVAGDGPDRQMLDRRIADLELQERVRFLGWRPDSDRILSALDLLVAPSLWEGFGLVVLEAMAHGIPVLASAVGAIPEIVVDGETGLLVPPADSAALRAGLERLLKDPELRTRLGAAGAERARSQFSLNRMIDDTLDFYEESARMKGCIGH